MRFFLPLALTAVAWGQTGLRCEYRVNPEGIDVQQPRLSWLVQPKDAGRKNVMQSGYRILASSTVAALEAGRGDLWDSGKVASSQSVHVEWAGKPLTSRTAVYWKVEVWDEKGASLGWSPAAHWSMGLLRAEDWKARWIGREETSAWRNPASPFRHLLDAKWIWPSGKGVQTMRGGFDVSGGVRKSAVCVMAADSSFELRLNGRSVGRGTTVQAPAMWDIEPYLRAGRNEFEITATPNARNTSGLIGAFRIDYAAGPPLLVTSGATWGGTELGSYGMKPWREVGYSEERALPGRLLRKEFALRNGVRRAMAYVSGLGLFEMYLNGSKTGDDVLAPNLTDYDQRVHYVTYDVTRQVRAGRNAVGVMLGNGRYWAPRHVVPTGMRSFGYPKARVQLEIEYNDGTKETVTSGDDWKLSTKGPVVANNEYDGEEYDARLEPAGWTRPGFPDQEWESAKSVPAPAGRMVAQMAEPIRVQETLRPKSMRRVRPGVYVFDMGQNMVGWCRLHVAGKRGTEVQLRHAESTLPGGELYLDNLRSALATDHYTLKGGGPEVWEPRFTYHGFRYVEVRGYPGVPKLAAIEGRVVHDALEKTADFNSSDRTLNSLHSNIYWGVRGNDRSIPTDCPQRDERQGWLGDRSVVSRSESYLFDVAAFYDKWETDIVDAQLATGSIPDVVPNYWTMYNNNVTWPSTFLQIPAMLYDQYADVRSIVRNYPAMKRWMDFMHTFFKDELLPKDTYGDWCVPPEDPKLIHSKDPMRQTEGRFLASAYYYRMSLQMARFARQAGKPDEASAWERSAAGLRKAFNQTFFHEQEGTYANGTQTAQALPLAFGMVPPGREYDVAAKLVGRIQSEDSHVGTGLVGAQWLMRALTESGPVDTAFQMVTQKTYPGWGYMLAKGATTIWELWNGDTADPAMNSGNHVMQIGDLGVWMYEYLAGIRADPEQPGFKHAIIRPYLPKGLDAVRASHKTMYGKLESSWKREGGKVHFAVVIPPNSTASVWLPAGVTGAGNSAPSRAEQGMSVFEIGSGSYEFTGPDRVK